MSAGFSLVVRFRSLEDMQTAIGQAHEVILTQVMTTLDRVDSSIAGWSPATLSREAELGHQKEIRGGVQRLTVALAQIGRAVEDVIRLAHETEVRNVALIG